MNRTRVASVIASLAITAALVVGVSTPAAAATYSGTKSCGTSKMPVVTVYGKSGTVDITYGRRGDTLDIKNTTKAQNFRAPLGYTSIIWTVKSNTLAKAPTVACVPMPS